MYKLTKNLINKSNDSFLLALELYNKPTIRYGSESFSLLFCTAWELLLKAYIYEQGQGKKLSIFRKKRRGAKRESISIDECLNKVFLNKNDPARRNVEYISEIRNEAAHLIIQELDPYFSRTFQAGIINYIDYLRGWFNIDLNEKLNPGLISLISDKDKILDIARLKGKFNKEDLNSIKGWVDKFKELDKLGNRATISIQHTIAIVKNPKKADFVISTGTQGKAGALIIEKNKDPNITHPFNMKSALPIIRSRIPKNLKFTEYDFICYTFVMGYKKSINEYYWRGKYAGAGQYSQKLIDELVEAINKKPNSLQQWRSQYKQYLKNKQKRIVIGR